MLVNFIFPQISKNIHRYKKYYELEKCSWNTQNCSQILKIVSKIQKMFIGSEKCSLMQRMLTNLKICSRIQNMVPRLRNFHEFQKMLPAIQKLIHKIQHKITEKPKY